MALQRHRPPLLFFFSFFNKKKFIGSGNWELRGVILTLVMAVSQASGNDNQILPPCCLCFILLTSLLSRLPPHSLRCHQQLQAFPSCVQSNNSLCDSCNEILVVSLIDHVWLVFFSWSQRQGQALSSPTDDFPEAKRCSSNRSRNAEQEKQQISSRGKHFKVFSNE